VLVPSLAAAAALAVLVALGAWQVERKAWKEALIATIAERLAAPPIAVPGPAGWSRLSSDSDEFLHVSVTVEFDNGKEALVYTSGSTLRDDPGGPGYWVFAPARLADGIVMVNRGFVPQDRRDTASRPEDEIAGPVTITGVLRWPEPPGLFTPAADPARNIWFSRDSAAIADAKGVAAAPFYIELEDPELPGGLPHPGRLKPNLPNNHLQHAITWFGLAAVLIGVYTAWLFATWRERHPIPRTAGVPPATSR
jgi:surfeit locus 1 family protein